MQEIDILKALEKITLNSFSDNEKSIILANTMVDSNIRTASNLNKTLLQKISEYSKGSYEELDDINKYPEPFTISNKDEIDEFLNKMMGKQEWEGNYFDDTFNTLHPVENMKANNVPRYRSDFNIVSNNV